MQLFPYNNTTEKKNNNISESLSIISICCCMKAGQYDKKKKNHTHEKKPLLMEIFRNFSAPVFTVSKAENTIISETGEITESFDPSGPKTMHIPNSWFFRMGHTKNGKLLEQNLSILNLSLFLFIPQSPSGLLKLSRVALPGHLSLFSHPNVNLPCLLPRRHFYLLGIWAHTDTD